MALVRFGSEGALGTGCATSRLCPQPYFPAWMMDVGYVPKADMAA